MRVLLFVMACTVLGCAHRPPAHVQLDPTGTPAEPTAACTVRRSQSRETVPPYVYVRPVTPEYRYDASGRLLFAVDQTEYVSVRKSWFFYDARDRLVHVHRRVDRVELPSMVFPPICDDGPCPPPPKNDQDGLDEDYRYDEKNRLVESVERFTRYDHQGGTWRDAPADPAPAAKRSTESDVASICDVEPAVCPRPRMLVGGTFRPFFVSTRTVTIHYQHAIDALPTSAHFSVLERWNIDGKGPWQGRRPIDDGTNEYAYNIEPRTVTRYHVRAGSRIPDLRIERDAAGRALHETHFSVSGDIWYEVSHRHDEAGRPVETIRSERTRTSTDRIVTTFAYDPLGRLIEVRETRPSDGSAQTFAYEYGAGCSNVGRIREDPPAQRDPIEQALERFRARP